jgi:hypothetical protein
MGVALARHYYPGHPGDGPRDPICTELDYGTAGSSRSPAQTALQTSNDFADPRAGTPQAAR